MEIPFFYELLNEDEPRLIRTRTLMGALISKTHLKGALIQKGRGLIGRRALNRITVLEAILTGKQPYTVLCVIFSLLVD